MTSDYHDLEKRLEDLEDERDEDGEGSKTLAEAIKQVTLEEDGEL